MLRVDNSETVPVEFSPELISKFADIVSRYHEGKQKSAMLPILH